jgi:diguanylate cyclase (GGDEF) domain
VADIISSLNHGSAWIFPFAVAGNYFEIILNTLMLPIYFLYVCIHISNMDMVLKRRINAILWILAAVCSAIVISTYFTEQVFYFDEAKIYHRGPLFWLPMSILFIMMLVIEGFIINQRPKIEARYYKSLILFLVLPLIGWALQFFIFGMPFSLISATFAAQVVFTNIQNRNMDTDYLTGVCNRQSLDNHMQSKIDTSTNSHSFSAILLDIDNFKSINDCCGHYEGDCALINTANLLRNSVDCKDFIARYGGDEFCIILDEDDPSAIEATIQHINSNLLDFNKNSKKPYRLSFSIGHAIYHPSIGNKVELFLKTIDEKMYDDKKSRRAANKITEM